MQTFHECKLLSLYEAMNKYSLIHVCKKTRTETTTFAIDGIITFRNNPKQIGLTRTFADPEIPNGFVTNVGEQDGKIIISCDEEQYILSPIQLKSTQKVCVLPNKFSINALISKQYIDETLVTVQNNIVYLPVSPTKLGTMNRSQKFCMQYLIDDVLETVSHSFLPS